MWSRLWNLFILLSIVAITFLTWDAILFDGRGSMKAIAFLYWVLGIFILGLGFE